MIANLCYVRSIAVSDLTPLFWRTVDTTNTRPCRGFVSRLSVKPRSTWLPTFDLRPIPILLSPPSSTCRSRCK